MPGELELLGLGRNFTDELCSMFESVQMFGDFKRQEVECLARFVKAYRAPAGCTLIHEGKSGGFMCILVSGRLEVLKQDDSQQPKRLAVIRPGKSIGEMSLIDGLPYSATVQAEQESTLLMLTRDNLAALNREYPKLAYRLLYQLSRLLSLRLRQTSGILVEYITEDK
jgi:CRP-like cAMP-binding protein